MAAMTLEHWLARLKPGQLPIFRHTRQALAALAPRGDKLGAKEIVAPILADPLATLRLIYTANNRSSRRFGGDVATVEHAILMQGVNIFLEKMLELPELEGTPQGQDKEILGSLYRLARLAQHASWQARDFATLKVDTRAEEIQVAAVLYYAPEFLFWLDAPDIADQLAHLRRRMRSAEAEQETLGFALPPLREMLLEAWKIPDVTRDLLLRESTGNPRQAILWAGLDIAHHSRRGWWDPRLLASYEALAGAVHMPVDEVIATVHDNAVRSARAGAWVPAVPAAAWLPLEPGEWPPEPERPQARASAPPTPEQELAGHMACPMPVQSVLEEAMATIAAHLDGSLTMNQMLAVILKGLHTGLGLSRVLFALVTPDGQRVKSRFTLGVPADDPLRQFEFPLAGKDLFGLLMGRMQSVWVNEENRGRLWPRVSPELRSRIGRGDFYAMSLFANDKPLGIIYGDRGHGDCELDAHTYDGFKRLCLEAAKGLGRVKPT
jgi:hypothetical protein